MAVLGHLLLVLATCSVACSRTEPPFACCQSDPGQDLYDALPPTPSTEAERAVVSKAIAAGVLPPGLSQDEVARYARRHAASRTFWERLAEARPAYTSVRARLAEQGAPQVLAAVPYALSRYETDVQASDCRAGPWLLPLDHPDLAVGPCATPDGSWTAGQPIPTARGLCAITGCRSDPRRDLATATAAALEGLPSDPTTAITHLGVGSASLAAAVHLLATCAQDDPAPPHCTGVRPP